MTRTTLREVWETQYRVRQLRSASIKTIRLWQISLDLIDRFLQRPATLADLTDDTLSRFATWRRRGGDVTAATVNRDLASLLALWRWCHRMRMVELWPDVQLEKE